MNHPALCEVVLSPGWTQKAHPLDALFFAQSGKPAPAATPPRIALAHAKRALAPPNCWPLVEDLAGAVVALKGQVGGLFVATSPDLVARREIVGTSAIGAQLPTVHSFRSYVDAGGLISYGADFLSLWRRAAYMVDKVLRGAKPADIPSAQPTKFELVVNLKTAKALGLTIAESFLIQADVIVE